ncbi:MAG: hypothetical protein LQ343_003594 [Gyalolechia ehrenbergii]|nr:MAG: hypothetical protein LQ343_003594 [Gyalolechia ehrenbergii]
MNTIREIQRLNQLELDNGVAPEASWHRDHADSAYIYIGGLPYNLSEGDIVTIFSQFGEPTFVKLVRDKETGKSKGFAYLKYEDQRSTDLAVDNLGGATVVGRMLKVDHTRYKKRDDEEEDDLGVLQTTAANGNDAGDTEREEDQEERPMLKEEKELAALLRDHDEDDPMKEYLIQGKKEEVTKALAKLKRREKKDDTSIDPGEQMSFRMKRRGGENIVQIGENQGVQDDRLLMQPNEFSSPETPHMFRARVASSYQVAHQIETLCETHKQVNTKADIAGPSVAAA